MAGITVQSGEPSIAHIQMWQTQGMSSVISTMNTFVSVITDLSSPFSASSRAPRTFSVSSWSSFLSSFFARFFISFSSFVTSFWIFRSAVSTTDSMMQGTKPKISTSDTILSRR